jgi:membrane associated rhomboid family serine protease
MATCYRHPNRETGVSCSNCGNPICPDCMTATPVGMRCPNCARQRTRTHTLRSVTADPIATYVLIGINVALFFGIQSSPQSFYQLVLTPADINPYNGNVIGLVNHEYWRLLTSGFTHQDWWHIGANGIALYFLGRMIEPALGHARFLGIYFASLFAGSLAVVIVDQGAYGASGAVYGLLGAAIVMARNRDISLVQSGLIPILAHNLIITIAYGFSLAGHIGGLIGGIVSTFVVEELARRRRNSFVPAVVACVALCVAAIAASVALAPSLPS